MGPPRLVSRTGVSSGRRPPHACPAEADALSWQREEKMTTEALSDEVMA